MTFKIKTGRHEQTVTTTRDYSSFEVADGIYAFRVETLTSLGDEVYIHQGLTKKTSLKMLAKGGFPARLDGSIFIVSDELKTDIARRGYYAYRDAKELTDGNEHIYDFLIAGGSPDQILRIDHYDNSFYRIDGSAFPTGILFNYMSGHFDNQHYDLDKAIAYLNTRDDVMFINSEQSGFFGEVVTAEAILVPWYNNDTGWRTHLEFFWTPTQEQADVLAENTAKKPVKKKYRDIYQTIFEHDMLGLRAAGAAYFDEYYKSKEYSEDY